MSRIVTSRISTTPYFQASSITLNFPHSFLARRVSSTMVDGHSTSKPASQKPYIRCRPCRAKFPDTRVGCRELRQHQAECASYIIGVSKTKQASSHPESKLSSTVLQQPGPSSTKVSDKAPVPPLEADSHYRTTECDLCGEKVILRESLNGNRLETHRNSKGCLKAPNLLQLQRTWIDEKDSEKNAGLQKYFKRSASQASLDKSNPLSSSDRTRNESVPSASSTTLGEKSESTHSKAELTPADADLMTLAYDVLWALTDLPDRKTVSPLSTPDR
ncbi:hypothetical protein JB92DRAFT_1995034 [Gautieria morchelliformis]|nr:hypothetical protein JB92DRAFT_1995034 [Gautieria morchelliformis]